MSSYFILRKTIRLLVSVILFSFLLYGLLYLSTGDPALAILQKLGGQNISQKMIEETRIKLGIDGNFFKQYLRWLFSLLKGDLGNSFMTNTPVLQVINEKIWVTVRLLSLSFFSCFMLSLFFGSIIGNFPFLRWMKQVVFVILSFPIYWLAILSIFLLGVKLKFFPFVGSSTSRHLILPTLVICLSEGSYLTKMVSDLILLVAESEKQKIAIFRGIKWYYRFYYQLKEVVIPLISLYGNSFIHLFGGTIMIEIIFSISGMGKLLMEAISTRDYPVIQGITLLVAIGTFLFNYLMDIVIQKVDSRIKLYGESI
ncbi:ABC transporter permease [Enterococcus faecalis]|uniref:ABC transporter permease n=1 Tax=Enterococcus faecalis TaxID=1351 RepID=UPI002090CDBE|nr:ABC transporter permease [Enterococcus faecalis]MCO5446205.1 ABC transporter permease [Enterococcus faecalis]